MKIHFIACALSALVAICIAEEKGKNGTGTDNLHNKKCPNGQQYFEACAGEVYRCMLSTGKVTSAPIESLLVKCPDKDEYEAPCFGKCVVISEDDGKEDKYTSCEMRKCPYPSPWDAFGTIPRNDTIYDI